MENWIFITILGAIIGVNSNTIVYPGKSALLSYSPARGEFPVESLFGRGYFSYVDDHGISRTVCLEPNPLLGVRVSGGDGKLSADLGNSVELRKGDLLKPIKEFDERPFQDNLHEKDMSFLAASVLDSSSKVVESSAQLKGDQGTNPKQQQEVIPLYQKAVKAPAQGSDITYWGGSQNLPLMLSNQPLAPRPFAVQGLFNPQNPFLNQQLGVPIASGVQQPLPGQVFFIPTTGAINPAVIPTSSGSAPQAFPQKPIGGIDPNPSELQELKPINQEIGFAGGPTSSIGGQGQIFINPAPNNPALTNPPVSIDSPQQMLNQVPEQIVPSVPVTSATSPASTIPGSEAPLLTKPQVIAPNPLLPPSNLPGILPGNSYLPPSKYPSIAQPPQEIFMIKPGNPFLELATNKDKPIRLPTTTTTTPPPPFNPDKNNPFFTNSLKPNVKLEVPTVLPTTVKPHLPGSTSCNYLSVGPPAPEQIKDTPEVEQAKRDHFKAHELALAQLAQAQARQNNDNTQQADESSLPLTSSVSDNSPLYLTANAPLDQQSVISGPTAAQFEQTTVNAAVESEIATIQPLPV